LDQANNPPIPKAKLRWRCRRGTKELDAILQGFLDRHYDQLSSQDQALFADLLEQADPDLQAWFQGRAGPPIEPLQGLLQRIIQAARV
jgi:antitoxin CptB